MSSPRCRSAQPAMIAAPVAVPAANLVSGGVLCAVSLIASGGPLRLEMPKLPKIKMPSLPNIGMPSLPDLPSLPGLPNLPGQGKTEVEAKAKSAAKAVVKTTSKVKPRVESAVSSVSDSVKPRVRAAAGKVKTPFGSENAPSYSDIRGTRAPGVTISSGEGWKRFPARRMPGASLDGFKKMASEVKPRF